MTWEEPAPAAHPDTRRLAGLATLVPWFSTIARARAVEAVSRIEQLGANRSKPLRSELERWLMTA